MRVEIVNTTDADITVSSLARTFAANHTIYETLNSHQYLALMDIPGLKLYILSGALNASYGYPKRKLIWFMSDDTFEYLAQDPQIVEKFGLDKLYIVGPPPDNRGLNITRNHIRVDVEIFWDMAAKGSIKPGESCLWACENSGGEHQTPTYQLDDIAGYAAQTRDILHSYGISWMIAPGLTTANYLHPSRPLGDDRDEAYIELNLAAVAAIHSDISESQTQHAQHDLPDFVEMVKQTTAQARKASKGKPHLAGLTTVGTVDHPTPPTVGQMADCAYRALPFVDGFWLNVAPEDQLGGAKDYDKALEFMRAFDW